jgi:hypothetical protein
MYDVYDERSVKARKAHICDACKETIAPGHRYWKVSIVFDGTAETVIRCLRCQEIHLAIRRSWIERGVDEMWPDEKLNCGEVWEDEHNGPPPIEVAQLAFMTQDEMQMRKS